VENAENAGDGRKMSCRAQKFRKFDRETKLPLTLTRTTQVHVPFEPLLYKRLKVAVKELGYGTISSWCRCMAIRTIQKWEAMKAKTVDEKSKETVENG